MLAARWSRDLTAAVALALLGLVLVLIPGGGLLEGAVLLGLVLVVPGYALAAALFQPRSIPPGERAVYAVALSIAIAGLGGLIVQVLLDLDRGVWAVLLLIVTAAACWVAQRKRDLLPLEQASPHLAVPSFNPLALLAVLAATGIASWAFSVAVQSARDSRREAHFAELWVLPSGKSAGLRAVSIGVGNHEGRAASFRVRVTRGPKALGEWKLRLASGEHWQVRLRTPFPDGASPLRVALLREGKVYRQAFLESGFES